MFKTVVILAIMAILSYGIINDPMSLLSQVPLVIRGIIAIMINLFLAGISIMTSTST